MRVESTNGADPIKAQSLITVLGTEGFWVRILAGHECMLGLILDERTGKFRGVGCSPIKNSTL